MRRKPLYLLLSAALIASPLGALPARSDAGPRETLTRAAFRSTTKAEALAGVNQAEVQANAILQRDPNSREARLQRAIALAYHAQLTRSLSEAKAAHVQFQQLVNENPNDPEAMVALASWHLTAVTNVGAFLARTMLGASKAEGMADLAKALALGRNRAMFAAYGAMLRIQLDPSDVSATRSLAQAAVATAAPTPIDVELQRRAANLLVPLNAGDGHAAAELAHRLMPLGQFG